VISAAPVPLPAAGPAVVPNGIAPVPAPPGGDGYQRNLTPVPQTPAPPLSGSSYHPPQRPLAPIPPQTLTPPLPPAPVPVHRDRIVSEPDGASRGPVEAIPATMIRTPGSR
jgi:hypothetical protein